ATIVPGHFRGKKWPGGILANPQLTDRQAVVAFAKTETIPPTSGHVRGRPTFSLRLSQWQLQAAQRNPLAVDAFGIQAREINSASLRLAQYDRLRREFARFVNSAVVRQHSGGRTTKSRGPPPLGASPQPMLSVDGECRRFTHADMESW